MTIHTRHRPYAERAAFTAAEARGPIIDQEGREIPEESLRPQSAAFRFDFGAASPFGNLTREQRLARLEAMAKILDVAFILPGTKIRYGVDGIITDYPDRLRTVLAEKNMPLPPRVEAR